MSLRIMPKSLLKTWIKHLQSRHFKVVGPTERFGQYVFEEIHSADELVMDYPTSVLPPKKYLLPPRERLFTFNAKTMEMQPDIQAVPTVILGVHTCDMHAVAMLDKVNNTGYADQHYKARREATYLVSVECLTPCMEGSFCKSMGTLTVPENYDLHFTDLGSDYAVEVGSEKGAALLEGCSAFWEPSEADYARVDAVIGAKWQHFPYRLECDVTELPDLLALSQKSPLWDELGERCLACGMCTKVCPTCYCFDVTDEIDLNLEHGERIRQWDSCQIEKFAVVAGGHNFRSSRALRQRHRFMRKGKYQYEAFGLMGCVGCGRCAASCLVHITPVDTFNALHRLRQAAQNGSAAENTASNQEVQA
ncbi:MAG: Ni/Fe hydrogenase subunit beta [Chloroflexi bacterium CFX4]|nr:Ni/Fe hydrogenase subunit beta [Chloroflexi bacterium CFX4]MDL1921582.1 Ni/Fe hydrogenase subunit beta [Chloroflexi bacterium CFX3]